jgi:multiple sugar transport system substrate-binding protein
MKPKNKKVIFQKFVISFLGIVLLAAGCGGTTTSSVQLVVWTVFEDSSSLQPLLDYYKTKRPNIRIVLEKKDPATYEEDLINALATGQGPDVFSIHNSWLPKYLDKVSSAPDAVWQFTDYKDTFVDSAVTDLTKDRKIYGATTYVDSLALYYNKDILGSAGIATPPKTWREFETDVRKIARLNPNGYFSRSGAALGLSSTAPGGKVNRAEDILYLMMLQKGVKPWSLDGLEPTFNDGVSGTASEEALRFYTSFADGTSLNYNWNTSSDYSIDAFANSRAALMINYSYARDLLQQKASNLNYDIATVPQQDLEGPVVNFSTYWAEVVSKQSKHQQEAWDFLKTITSKPALDKYAAARKLPSSRRDLIELQAIDPDIGVFANANLTAKSFYRPNQQKFDAIISNMIDDVTLRNMEPQEALSKASQQAGELPKGK